MHQANLSTQLDALHAWTAAERQGIGTLALSEIDSGLNARRQQLLRLLQQVFDTLTAYMRKILATGGELASGVATRECQNPFTRLACPAMCDQRDGVSVQGGIPYGNAQPSRGSILAQRQETGQGLGHSSPA